MSKRVLVITASFRKGGNSETLANAFARGAEDAGHAVEKVWLGDKDIRFCTGCLACQRPGPCPIRDDMAAILAKIRDAQVIVFATPIYYYEMSGQMKTLLDRCNPLYPVEYAFRDVYLLATAADSGESAVDNAVHGLEGWISCFEKASLRGVIRGVGADRPGDIQNLPQVISAAYEMGRGI